jgi:hypothetical protein
MSGEAWFRPKDFGYGNVPITWKGWALTIAFATFIIALVVTAELRLVSPMLCVAAALLATLIYLPVIKAKTAGEWRWRWRRNPE